MLLRILMTFIFIKWHRCRGKIVIRALELVTSLEPQEPQEIKKDSLPIVTNTVARTAQ